MPTPAETQAQYGTLAAQPTTPTAPPVVNPNVPTPPASEVLSPTNVAQTLTAPAAPYDYSDPLKIQARVREELGLGKVESEYQTAIDNLRKFDTGTTTQQFNIEQELNPLGVIRGEQATAAGQRSLYRQGYADTAQALADRYNALQTEATNRFNILNQERATLQSLMISNPGAKITYTDTVETANKKVADWQKKEAKKAEKKAKEAEKEAYKKQLKAALMEAGISTKGTKGGSLNTKEMEAALTASRKAALDEAKRKAAGTGSADQTLRGNITTQIYAGTINREAAKAIYEQQTGKSGDWVYAAAPDGYEKNVASSLTPAQQLKMQQDEEAKAVAQGAVFESAQKRLGLLNDVTGRGVGAGFFGTIERNLPSPTGALANNINTIKSIIGSDTLNSLLQLKAQGGTLGAVSEKELSILQASANRIGAAQLLDSDGNVKGYNMTEKQFNKEIESMKAATNRVLEATAPVGSIIEKNGKRYKKVANGWEEL